MSLENLRVLFMPHAPRQRVLSPIVRAGREHYGWRVGLMLPVAEPGPNADLLSDRADFFRFPNLEHRAPWEEDPAAAAKVRALVQECERAAGLPIHRLVLPAERAIGRAYGVEHYHWPMSRLARRVLRDNAEPARIVERIFACVAEMFDRFRPDLIVGGHLSSPYAMVVWLIARNRGIPCVANRPSKILSHRGFWTDHLRMLNAGAERRCRERIAERAAASDQAKAYLAEFRDRPRTVAYIQRNWDNTSTFLKRHWSLALQGAMNVRYHLRGRQTLEPKTVLPRFLEMYRSAYLVRRQRSLYTCFDETVLQRTPYLFMALHKEPELALNVQHPEWHSQKNLIAMISYNLPAGYRMFVRDHRFNEGRRPTGYLRDITRYPGVTLIDPFDPQFKYIRNASLIITDSGTTGFEGLIFGRPVLLLGENYYSITGLAPVCDAPARLGEAILSALDRPLVPDDADYEQRLGALIDAEYETTQSDEDVDGSLRALSEAVSTLRTPQPLRSAENVPVPA